MTVKYIRTILTFILLSFLFNCGEGERQNKSEVNKESDNIEKFTPPELTDNLLGSWIRPDGGYNLQIMEIRKNTVDAAYFNPNSIIVSETQWKFQDGYVYLYVKFDDTGYEGSYYSLGYIPDKDILAGFYYQAPMNQKYEVYFERDKD